MGMTKKRKEGKKKQELLNANRGTEEVKHISELRTGTSRSQKRRSEQVRNSKKKLREIGWKFH